MDSEQVAVRKLHLHNLQGHATTVIAEVHQLVKRSIRRRGPLDEDETSSGQDIPGAPLRDAVLGRTPGPVATSPAIFCPTQKRCQLNRARGRPAGQARLTERLDDAGSPLDRNAGIAVRALVDGSTSSCLGPRFPSTCASRSAGTKYFYREMVWSLRNSRRPHPYLLLDLLLQAAIPFRLIFALMITAYQGFLEGPRVLVHYLVVVTSIAVVRALYGVLRTRDLGY